MGVRTSGERMARRLSKAPGVVATSLRPRSVIARLRIAEQADSCQAQTVHQPYPNLEPSFNVRTSQSSSSNNPSQGQERFRKPALLSKSVIIAVHAAINR